MVHSRFASRPALIASLLVAFTAGAFAGTDARSETVRWTASVQPEGAAKPGNTLTLTLNAQVQKGWHVYALKQLAGGPTPLLVKLDPNTIAAASGEPAGSPPTKLHDPSFDLDTQFYDHAFAVTLPLQVASRPAAGHHLIPVSVRFQTCNGQICQPPKTVHLSAPVTVAAR